MRGRTVRSRNYCRFLTAHRAALCATSGSSTVCTRKHTGTPDPPRPASPNTHTYVHHRCSTPLHPACIRPTSPSVHARHMVSCAGVLRCPQRRTQGSVGIHGAHHFTYTSLSFPMHARHMVYSVAPRGGRTGPSASMVRRRRGPARRAVRRRRGAREFGARGVHTLHSDARGEHGPVARQLRRILSVAAGQRNHPRAGVPCRAGGGSDGCAEHLSLVAAPVAAPGDLALARVRRGPFVGDEPRAVARRGRRLVGALAHCARRRRATEDAARVEGREGASARREEGRHLGVHLGGARRRAAGGGAPLDARGLSCFCISRPCLCWLSAC